MTFSKVTQLSLSPQSSLRSFFAPQDGSLWPLAFTPGPTPGYFLSMDLPSLDILKMEPHCVDFAACL